MPAPAVAIDTFTPEETRALDPYFTNTDRPVFALKNLPETVKGALFARYSRSAKSLRRLFLDEFLGQVGGGGGATADVGSERAAKLYARVLGEFGDDSVAQLGSAHLACEGVSNVLTKVLEWGRLMAYLEQSTGTCRTPIARTADGSITSPPSSTARRCARRSSGRSTPRSRPTHDGFPRSRRISARDIRSRRRIPTASIGRSSAPRRWTRCAGCCRRRRSPTSVCSVPGRGTKRCCCGCSRIRSRRSGPTRTRCWPSCDRSSRRSSPASISRSAAGAGSSTWPRRAGHSRRPPNRSSTAWETRHGRKSR